MKLLYVLPEYHSHAGGGIATFYRLTLPELVRLGHQVHVLAGSAFTSRQEACQREGITIEYLDDRVVTNAMDSFGHYSAFPSLQRHLAAAWTAWEQAGRGKGFDLVETTDWGLLFVPWIVEPQVPAIVQLHGSIGQVNFHDPMEGDELSGHLIRLLESGLLAQADALQASTPMNAEVWKELMGKEVTCLAPAWAPETFSPSQGVRSSSSHDPDRGLVTGRIQYWKGPTVLCEALRLLGPKAPLIDWVGQDMDYRRIGQSMSDALYHAYPDIWGKKVRVLGPRTPAQVAELQSRAPFILVPSLWDVLNYSCVEGMGRARNVLCSLGAGASSFIRNKVNGLTFDAHDPAALAGALADWSRMSPDQKREMGQKAQKTILGMLTPDVTVRQRVKAYQALVRKKVQRSRMSAWLRAAASPSENPNRSLAFLDHLSLKDLARKVATRGVKKILG